MSPSDRRTLTEGNDAPAAERSTISSYLVLGFEATRPGAPPLRLALSPGRSIALAGGPERALAPEGDAVRISVPDRWMSARHAELRESFGRWGIRDTGSKNGTQVNGIPIDEGFLSDGDVVITGRTVWLFRQVETPRPIGDRDESAPAPGRFATLSGPLECALDGLAGAFAAAIPILIRGPSGAGKDVLARVIHERARPGGPFVAVNCGAIAPSLIETTLFGQRRGAFTGATEDRPGVIRSAAGGTLFLDEIAELPRQAQAGLLRALENREVVPVGDATPLQVDFRLVAATHRDLEALCARGEFRGDLYARIRGAVVELPPLADRREDVFLVAHRTLATVAAMPSELTIDACQRLLAYGWPLNAREVRHAIERAAAVAAGGPITAGSLPPEVAAAEITRARPSPRLAPDLEQQKASLRSAMERHGGNVSAVARELGKDRKQVYRWLRQVGLLRDDDR